MGKGNGIPDEVKDDYCRQSPLPGAYHGWSTFERMVKGNHMKVVLCKYCGLRPKSGGVR